MERDAGGNDEHPEEVRVALDALAEVEDQLPRVGEVARVDEGDERVVGDEVPDERVPDERERARAQERDDEDPLLHDEAEAVTHIAIAFDNPIRSFRNDLFDAYKSDEGVPPELLAEADVTVEIPQLGVLRSLNVGSRTQAVLAISEMSRPPDSPRGRRKTDA